MESITKNRQSLGTLRQMIAKAYGPQQVPAGDDFAEELGHGWFNVAYKIRLRDGSLVVLKIAPPPQVEVMAYEHGAMATELAALALIRERTSTPVPAVDFADRNHDLCNADWFFMPFIEADNFGIVRHTLPQAEQDRYDEALGAATRELNSIHGPAFGPLGGPGVAAWRELFTDMVEDVLRDGERRNVDLGWDYDTIRTVVVEHADCLDEVTEPCFVEWDLWDSNVMVRDGDIACIVDHERAYYGDPLIEAGFVATQMPAFGDPTSFMRGYGKTELTAGEQQRRRLYCVHLTLIMIIETVYRGHTDTNQYDWAREQLSEAMALFGRSR